MSKSKGGKLAQTLSDSIKQGEKRTPTAQEVIDR
jgi:hypothetical protein